MRSKRTLFSMMIFISVFWVSIVINAGSLFSSADIKDKAADIPVTVSDNSTEDANKNEIKSFSSSSPEEIASSELFMMQGEPTQSQQDINVIYGVDGSSDKMFLKENTPINERMDIAAIVGEDNSKESGPYTQEGNIPEPSDAPESLPSPSPSPAADNAQAKTEPAKKASKYSDIAISIAGDFVNIRQKASTDSKVLGKLYNGSAATILKSKGDWYYVESGSVKGYVKSDYVKTGIPDEELINKYGILRINVDVDGLNVREKPNTDSEKLTTVYQDEKYPVMDLQDEWVKVDITDDRVIGYVKRDYIDLIVDFKKAVSKEEEAELERLKAEERAKKETEVKYGNGVAYTKADVKLLACLIHAEAGNQSYEGRLAVANIVLNRVKSSKFPDNIHDVIYSPGQFSVARSGSLAKQLANYDDYSTSSQLLSIKAAKAALEGANNIGNRLYFHSYRSAVSKGYDHKDSSVKLDDQLYW